MALLGVQLCRGVFVSQRHQNGVHHASLLGAGSQLGDTMYPDLFINRVWIAKTKSHSTCQELPPLFLLANRRQFLEAKSLVAAVCMGYVSAHTATYFFCNQADVQCNGLSYQRRSLYLAILYQFFRETACDVRDIEEDERENLKTIPVRLGKEKTLLLLAGIGIILDNVLTGAILVSNSSVRVDVPAFVRGLVRVCLTIAAYSRVLKYTRDHFLAWGQMALLGLLPVLLAQAELLGND